MEESNTDLDTLFIRQTSIKDFMRCRRKWAFNYLKELEVARPANEPHGQFSLGTIVHKAIEAYWKDGVDPLEVVSGAEQEIHDQVGNEALSPEWIKVFSLARAMMTGYAHWAGSGDMHNIEALGCEVEAQWDMGKVNGVNVVLTGIIDRIERDRMTDFLAVTDIKTTAQFQSHLTHTFQLLTYGVLLQENQGITPDVLYTEQIKKVLRTGKAKPPYFSRIETYCNPQMLDNHRRYLRHTIGEMVEAWRAYQGTQNIQAPWLYPHRTRDCKWDCPYLPLCVGTDDGSNVDILIGGAYRVRQPKETQDS